ncbi:hypothetical protein MHBO_003009, partial [Bonamia ostreae]
ETIEKQLKPKHRPEIIGEALIKQLFKSYVKNDHGVRSPIAGSIVTSGQLKKGLGIFILRNGKEIYRNDDGIETLRRFKDYVDEVEKGKECGVSLGSCLVHKEGDVIKGYKLVPLKREVLIVYKD